MKLIKSLRRSISICILALCIALGCAVSAYASQSRIQLTATTSIMGCLLRDVGGRWVRVTVLMPPGSCPGHYDMRPEDARILSRGASLFVHGYESTIPKIVESSSLSGKKVHTIKVTGNWLLPSVYAKAAKEVARELDKIDPTNQREYKRLQSVVEHRTQNVNHNLQASLKRARIAGTPVLCSDQIAPLLRWMGLSVVGTYGRAEDLTPQVLHRLLATGRKSRVRLVVDNLQSGPTTGSQLASELGVRRIVLSNFPGGFAATPTWETCLRDNVRRIVSCISKSKHHE